VTPANVPEAAGTDAIMADLGYQDVNLVELHMDRAYLPSRLVRERPGGPGGQLQGLAGPQRQGSAQDGLSRGLGARDAHLPQPGEQPFQPGEVVHFPQATCAGCSLREQCTSSPRGHTVTVHPDERLLFELRQKQLTPLGRQKLRQRVYVEHSLAHLGHIQGHRARFIGVHKNLFDLRRTAVVHNLHQLSHDPQLLMAA
jgi:transposase